MLSQLSLTASFDAISYLAGGQQSIPGWSIDNGTSEGLTQNNLTYWSDLGVRNLEAGYQDNLAPTVYT